MALGFTNDSNKDLFTLRLCLEKDKEPNVYGCDE